MYYVYVAVYGRANAQNQVGAHTIRPRAQQSQPPTLEDGEAERERLHQREIAWEDEMEEHRAESPQADLQEAQAVAETDASSAESQAAAETDSSSAEEDSEAERERLRQREIELEEETDRRQLEILKDMHNQYMESLAAFETDASSAKENKPPTTSMPASKVKGDEDSASDLDSNLSEQADDEDPDLLTIGVEADRTWLTIEDMELRRISKLATHLRKDPLLPSPPAHCEALLQREGLNFPLVHCAFENCEWVSDSRPCLRCTVDENTWPRHVAGGMWCELHGREQHRRGILGCCGQNTCLKHHIVARHSDALLESCGEAELRQPFFRKGKTVMRGAYLGTCAEFVTNQGPFRNGEASRVVL